MTLQRVVIFVFLLLAIIEVFYRFAIRSTGSNSGRDILVAHTNARYEPFELVSRLEAVTADSGIHRDFWEEMQLSMKNQLFATAIKTTDGLVHDSADYQGSYFSTVAGLRTTTDQPNRWDKTIALFGGSTIFCYETQDSDTVSSHLQRLVKNLHQVVLVKNYGVAGAGAIERCRKIRHVVSSFSKSDQIVLLFGDNDCGWVNYRENMPRSLAVGLKISKFWRSLELWALKSESKFAHTHSALAARHTLEEIALTQRVCSENNLKFTAILQPNIYTKKELSAYESAVVRVFGSRHKKMILSAYEIYRSSPASFIVNAEAGFDNFEPSVFLDWAHVESRGNRALASFMLSII